MAAALRNLSYRPNTGGFGGSESNGLPQEFSAACNSDRRFTQGLCQSGPRKRIEEENWLGITARVTFEARRNPTRDLLFAFPAAEQGGGRKLKVAAGGLSLFFSNRHAFLENATFGNVPAGAFSQGRESRPHLRSRTASWRASRIRPGRAIAVSALRRDAL